MSMLDDTYAAMQAAIAAHAKLVGTLRGLASEWGAKTSEICPDYPDCNHDYDSAEIESHTMATTYYELAQELLGRIDRGKICTECEHRIPDAQLPPDAPERCLIHKDPG